MDPYLKIEDIKGNRLIHVDNELATATISVFGAHVLSFCPKSDNRDRLWLSEITQLDSSEAIRGGIPICWPWFSKQFPNGESGLASHGFLRTQAWHFESNEQLDTGETLLTFILAVTPQPGFNHTASLTYRVYVGSRLKVELEVTNTDVKDMAITGALHTYFNVDDIHTTEIEGISGNFRDKTQDFNQFPVQLPYTFVGETDRVHLVQTEDLVIRDENNCTKVSMSGHDSIVIWNPWIETSKSITNIRDNDYLGFVCVEAAITSEAVIPPSKVLTLTQTIG